MPTSWVSRNPALFSSAYENGGHRIFNENEVGLTGAGESAIGIPFISRDPPVHTQYRKHIMPAVSPPGSATSRRASARGSSTSSRRSRWARKWTWCRCCPPSPLLTLCELLGLSPDLWPKLYDWTNAFVGEDDPDFRQSPEAMAATLADFFAFATELFEARRAAPSHDIASLLANVEIHGEKIAFRDFVGNRSSFSSAPTRPRGCCRTPCSASPKAPISGPCCGATAAC
jgi:linalool 8-monooxygenase